MKLEAVVSLRVRHNFINQLGRRENYLYPNNSEALRESSKLLYNIGDKVRQYLLSTLKRTRKSVN